MRPMQPHSASALAVAFWTSLVLCACASDFQINFAWKTARIIHDLLSGQYELIVDFTVTKSVPQTEGVSKVNALRDLAGVAALVHVSQARTGGHLLLLCRGYAQCENLKRKIQAIRHLTRQDIELLPLRFSKFLSAPYAVNPSVVRKAKTIVFQQNINNRVSFAQNWATYASGFGDPSGNYWMGLQHLSALTASGHCILGIEAMDFIGEQRYAYFSGFQVLGASENFKLKLRGEEPYNRIGNLTAYSGVTFSTFDRDTDPWKRACSHTFGKVGWWFNMTICHYVSLNTPIADSPWECYSALPITMPKNIFGWSTRIGIECFTKAQMWLRCD